MPPLLIQISLFLLNLVFNFFIGLVKLRFLLQWVKADFYNPLCQFVMKMTNWALLPLRRIIPGFFGVDFAAIVLILLAEAAFLALISLLSGLSFSGVEFALVVLLRLATLLLNLYFFIIIIQAFLSFSAQAYSNPVFQALSQLLDPLYRPIRQVIRPISGFDLSPLIVLIAIQILLMCIRSLSAIL